MSSISKVLGEPSAFVEDALPFPLIEEDIPAELLDEEGRTDEIAAASPDDGCGSGFARMVWVVGMSGLAVWRAPAAPGPVALDWTDAMDDTDPDLNADPLPVLVLVPVPSAAVSASVSSASSTSGVDVAPPGNRCLAWLGECPELYGVSGIAASSSSVPAPAPPLPSEVAPPSEVDVARLPDCDCDCDWPLTLLFKGAPMGTGADPALLLMLLLADADPDPDPAFAAVAAFLEDDEADDDVRVFDALLLPLPALLLLLPLRVLAPGVEGGGGLTTDGLLLLPPPPSSDFQNGILSPLLLLSVSSLCAFKLQPSSGVCGASYPLSPSWNLPSLSLSARQEM